MEETQISAGYPFGKAKLNHWNEVSMRLAISEGPNRVVASLLSHEDG
jgi:hypothetical protein